MAYTLVPYHAPLRPVHLSFVYVTAHEKVPETKKGDDGVLLSPDEVYGALSCASYKLRINFCCQV